MPSDTRFSEVQKSLAGRWKPDWSTDGLLAPMAAGYNKAMSAVSSLMAKKEAMRASGKFSNQGLTEETRGIARRETVPALRSAALAIERSRLGLRDARAAIVLGKVNVTNAADAVLRSEMRGHLKSLPQTQAVQVLLSDGVDERLVQAALEGPPVLSGLTAQMRDMVENKALERHHGPALAALEDRDDAADVAQSALDIAIYQLRQEVDLPHDGEFDNWMEEATKELELAEAKAVLDVDLKPDDGSMKFVETAIDEAFAKAFPTIYPDHPVNQKVA